MHDVRSAVTLVFSRFPRAAIVRVEHYTPTIEYCFSLRYRELRAMPRSAAALARFPLRCWTAAMIASRSAISMAVR